MALQTSGPISLDDIHVEAGGTTATQAGINDTDILNLIGKSSATQMGFDEWYGASAGPTLQYTTTGTRYTPATTGKNAAPAAIYFENTAAGNIVGDSWTGASTGYIGMTDYGWLDGSGGFKPGGFFYQTTGNASLPSSSGSFARNPGTGVGQYYMKVLYNNTLIFQTSAHYDDNSPVAPQIGNPTGPAANIYQRTNASLWTIEYYR